MSIRETIVTQFKLVATEQKKNLAPLVDELPLVDSGLDSLSFAIIVTRLEDELGNDPFSASQEVYFPVTFGDFVRLYENGAA
ncbi:MAG: acyl carrier protein [Alphaproteobacteria bacterium]|nr:acyl carrier protein [Alphaproteobacteria bacterium]MCL2453105.1 acyl carrier protein [Alphaproteobacteria bacterium]